MMHNHLNRDSLERISNIEYGFRNFPLYSGFDIRNYRYNFRTGVQALEVSKNGIMVNLFLFFPDPSGNGKIESIALYGSNLQDHYNVMRNSMMAFGMKISSISFESGQSDYLDIYLDY